MAKRIENILKSLTIEELQEALNIATNLIHDFKDGFIYECRVRSYGRNWIERPTNAITVQELCYRYGGDDGIVDIYTNNPDLRVDNYGDTLYFPTLEDAETWRSHRFLTNAIPGWKKDIANWENRHRLPFRERPSFAPYIDEVEIANHEAQLMDLTQKLVQPVRLSYTYEEEDTAENC